MSDEYGSPKWLSDLYAQPTANHDVEDIVAYERREATKGRQMIDTAFNSESVVLMPVAIPVRSPIVVPGGYDIQGDKVYAHPAITFVLGMYQRNPDFTEYLNETGASTAHREKIHGIASCYRAHERKRGERGFITRKQAQYAMDIARRIYKRQAIEITGSHPIQWPPI